MTDTSGLRLLAQYEPLEHRRILDRNYLYSGREHEGPELQLPRTGKFRAHLELPHVPDISGRHRDLEVTPPRIAGLELVCCVLRIIAWSYPNHRHPRRSQSHHRRMPMIPDAEEYPRSGGPVAHRPTLPQACGSQ